MFIKKKMNNYLDISRYSNLSNKDNTNEYMQFQDGSNVVNINVNHMIDHNWELMYISKLQKDALVIIHIYKGRG
jgi:hypothetical protein